MFAAFYLGLFLPRLARAPRRLSGLHGDAGMFYGVLSRPLSTRLYLLLVGEDSQSHRAVLVA